MEEHVFKECLDKGKIHGPYKHWDNVEEGGDEPGEAGTGKAGKQKQGKENEPAHKRKQPKSHETVVSDQDGYIG